MTVDQGTTVETTKRFIRQSGFAAVCWLLAALALVTWLVTDAEPQLFLALAILVVLGVDLYLARSALGGLTIHLQGPASAFAGEPTEWTVQVDGVRRPLELTPALAPRPRPVRIDDDGAGTIVLPPTFRGVAHSVVLDLVAHGPLGLFRTGMRARVAPPIPVYVGPRAERFDPEFPKPKAVGFGFSEVAPKGDDLFRSVRPYLRGDERRRIHWPSTARHGELMVRESEGAGVVHLMLVVDLGPPGPLAEPIAAAAAWTAEEALRRSWAVELVTLDSGSDPPPAGRLGTPFGPPPVPMQVPMRLATRRERVGGARDVRMQLASAAYGTPEMPITKGLVCTITPRGIEWL